MIMWTEWFVGAYWKSRDTSFRQGEEGAVSVPGAGKTCSGWKLHRLKASMLKLVYIGWIPWVFLFVKTSEDGGVPFLRVEVFFVAFNGRIVSFASFERALNDLAGILSE
jgi:hypothetical protein